MSAHQRIGDGRPRPFVRHLARDGDREKLTLQRKLQLEPIRRGGFGPLGKGRAEHRYARQNTGNFFTLHRVTSPFLM